MEQTYLLWIKPGHPAVDFEVLETSLCEVQWVESVDIAPLPASSGVSKKEVVLAVTLSVTANFVTDGLKAVIKKLTDEKTAEVIYCRRPDGQEVPVRELVDTNADSDGPHGEQ